MGLVTFICNDCNTKFDEPKRLTDWVECWGHLDPMYTYVCPVCGSDDFKDETEDDDNDG